MTIHGDYKEPTTAYYSQSFFNPSFAAATIPYLSNRIPYGNPISPKTAQIDDIYNRRIKAIQQQLSQFGSITPAQQESYNDATKAKALQNFATLTDTRMEAAVLKNWEKKIETYIQLA